jgi:predicted nucleic acid-binding protein
MYAEKHELSVDDACYAVLAEAQGGVLVTAEAQRKIGVAAVSPW